MHRDRQWIEAHIPHKGRMCLLDEVLCWDSTRIRCRSGTHRSADNPLRLHGRLGAVCGIEYGAQAMAVHGALLARTIMAAQQSRLGQPSFTGYLASVRDVALHVARLDDLPGDLIAEAERIMSNERTALYALSISTAGRVLLRGRATVVFGALAVPAPSQVQTSCEGPPPRQGAAGEDRRP